MSNRLVKKVFLLSPDITRPIFNQNGRLKIDRFLPPLGFGYLAAVIRKKGYEVRILDCIAKPTPLLKKEILRFKPQVVGISCFTEHRGGSLKLARLVKKIDKKIIVVFGGSHATFMYDQLLSSYKEIDFCVLGEGEETFPELLEEIFKEGKENYSKTLGIAFRKRDRVVTTGRRQWLLDLDELPFPDRSWVDTSLYKFPHEEAIGQKIASLITARGCPFACQFCSTSQFWGKRTRARSVANVIQEIDFLWKEGFRVLNFLDDTFTLDEERTQEICREIIKRRYKFLWCCSTRAGLVSKKTAKLMKKAGCFSVTIGVESLSPTILQNINKRINIPQAVETFKNLREAGIKNGCLLMVGNNGENWQSVKETVENLKIVNPGSIFTNLTQVYPGTPLYELAGEKGFVNDDYWLNEKKAAPIYLAENSLRRLLEFERKIWEGFFLRKKDYLRWFSRKSGVGSKI